MNFLFVDDHPVFRLGMRKICETNFVESTFYEAGDVATAIHILQELSSSIVFLDINLGDSNGIRFLKDYQDLVKDAKIIMLSMYDDKALIQEAFNLGAKAFLSKDADDEEIITCVNMVLRGQKYVNSSILNVMTTEGSPTDRGGNPYSDLTKTERQVIKLVAESLSSKAIAERMNISYRTVQNHRSKICQKLGLEGTNALTRNALKNKNSFW